MDPVLKKPFGPPVNMRRAYGEALVALGQSRPDLVVLSADVSNSDHSFMFEARFPDRFINVGIAEQALVDVAVGFAKCGRVPIANTFAFLFATRALEQVRTHLAYGRANVKLAGAYAGLSDSFDGPTHQSINDLAVMRSLPNLTVVVPADPVALDALLPQMCDMDGPVFFRLCRNEVPVVFGEGYRPTLGRAVQLRDGRDLTLIACGVMVAPALEAAESLASQGVQARVVEMHTLKPLDTDMVARCAEETGAIVTVEEHSIIGGLGGAVAEALAAARPAPLERVGIRDQFTESGPYADLLRKYGLAAPDIVQAAQTALRRKENLQRQR
ncbi:MAG: transketolase family protein [Candidatus Sumerlaeia bacterium]|nr:transketolase family protein [Candidatus Sumerlaeia bacterium]